MKRLYEVHIDVYAYVLAKSEREAEGMAHEILKTEDPNVDARPVPRNAVLAWPDGCLVYGADKDMTLGEAVAKYVES